MEMLTWTNKLTILTHGHPPGFPPRSRQALDRFDIPVRREVVSRLEGTEGMVRRAVFEDGSSMELEAVFFHVAYGPGCSLPAELGCKANAKGILRVNREFETTVPGIFATGDITPGSKLAVRAAAEGARAALGVYRSLLPPERKV
jgi:thioredoxin reductase